MSDKKTVEYHISQAYLENDGYLILQWPKVLSLRALNLAIELVNFQLEIFRESAVKESYADLEYHSWSAQ